MKTVNTVALVLVVVGGLNWLLVGLFDYNLVEMLFGEGSVLTKTVYVLVGVSALWVLWDMVMSRSKTAATA